MPCSDFSGARTGIRLRADFRPLTSGLGAGAPERAGTWLHTDKGECDTGLR